MSFRKEFQIHGPADWKPQEGMRKKIKVIMLECKCGGDMTDR